MPRIARAPRGSDVGARVKSVLITGGSGFFGTALVKRLLTMKHDNPHRIVVYSRGEYRQAEMARELAPFDPHEHLRMFIGDVRDRDRLRRAMEDVEVVFHAAALKRIETAFYNPIEISKTNIGGASNVIEAAHDAHVSKVVALSTDKVFQPVSPYGTSKAFAESLFLAANNMRGKRGPIFAVCRYGNIFESTGSVVPTWRKMLAEGADTVPVTDPDCTRFFMTIEEAVDLVLNTAETMRGGEIVIPTLPAYRLGDLAEAMGAKMRVIGLPDWEKRDESMAEGNSSDKARRMSVAELREVLR
jgi:UDP-N-acetylglucosamine 4,6-dehydratase